MGFAINEDEERRQRSQGFFDFLRNSTCKNKCGMIFLVSYLLTFLLIFYLAIEV
jgi:hypothetical protein